MSDLTLVRELYGDVSAGVQIVWPDSAGRMPWMCRMALAGQAISSFQLTFGRKREWLRLSDVIVCNAFRDGGGVGDWSRAVGAAVESWSLVEKIAKRSPWTVSRTGSWLRVRE